MCLPNFIICGASKGGTTALMRYLGLHPQIYIPPYEIHFFTDYYHKGLEWYKRRFKHNKVCGEKSPSYMIYADISSKRIYNDLFPNPPKLIFMLRNPVERAYSLYLMRVLNGLEKRPFKTAIWDEEEYYLKSGIYTRQINAFLKYFSPDDILILISEDFRKDRQERMKEIFDFLNVPQISLPSLRDKHVGGMPKNSILTKLTGSIMNLSGHSIFAKEPILHTLLVNTAGLIKKFNKTEGKKPPIDAQLKIQLYDYYYRPNEELKNLLVEIGRNDLVDIIDREWVMGDRIKEVKTWRN